MDTCCKYFLHSLVLVCIHVSNIIQVKERKCLMNCYTAEIEKQDPVQDHVNILKQTEENIIKQLSILCVKHRGILLRIM